MQRQCSQEDSQGKEPKTTLLPNVHLLLLLPAMERQNGKAHAKGDEGKKVHEALGRK